MRISDWSSDVCSSDLFLDRWLYVGFSLVLILFFADHVRLHFRTVRERDTARYAAQRLELDLLKQHLKPHFLMNTLTALAGWIEESPRTAVRMVDALADEFRTLVDVSGRALIPLERSEAHTSELQSLLRIPYP